MLKHFKIVNRRLRRLGLVLFLVICMGLPALANPLTDLIYQLPIPNVEIPDLPVFSPEAAPATPGQVAQAVLRGTTEAPAVIGSAVLIERADGVHMVGSINGVRPGLHGFHIHEGTQCGADGQAAGGHFNPYQTPHGFLLSQGFEQAHAGDLGNLDIAANGQAQWQVLIPGLTLDEGLLSVANRAIVVHAQPDDFSQPTGNAGGRIACGLIQVVPPPQPVQ
ncbi:MAG: superoxide dismutase family protein [Nodosilinea sp.]